VTNQFQSYCTYSAFGETGDDPVNDPVYPDTAPNGYTGQLQCGVYKPTNVISVSYGGQEDDLPAYYQKRQCNEFLKLGLQGVSIFYASGDDGVAGNQGGDSANGCLGPDSTIFNPAWPNTCPYITNVGATKVYPGRTVYEPESAVVDPAGHPYRSAFSSGGGFSNIYPVPDYQKDAVDDFFANYMPSYPYYTNALDGSIPLTGGLYNRIGRGYPDVAANGDNIATYVQGSATLEGGTSASTPIFASIVNRINEERISRGKNPVGFINPTLYKNPHVLNDITNGTNPGCGTVGFKAVRGWDPVTGLGTPNYPKMLDLFLDLP
jgi:tripeptidyl-peptidase-1